MDILTPKGQVTRQQEQQVIAAFHKKYPEYLYAETHKERDSVNDGIILNRKTSVIVAVCETKCRGASLDQFENKWHRRWLITNRKIQENMQLARAMRCYFTGILYLTQSNLILMKHLYDGNADKWLAEYNTAHCETQRNINGGRTIRENAFVDMSGAQRFVCLA
jgi:hypothetical protein